MKKYFLSLFVLFSFINFSSAKPYKISHFEKNQKGEKINLNFVVLEDFSTQNTELDEAAPNCLPVIICIACPSINNCDRITWV